MKTRLAIIVAAAVAAACGSSGPPHASTADKLFEAVSPAAVAVVDAGTKSIDHRLALGVPSPDWKHLYSIVATSLVDTDPATGETQATLRLGGAYSLPEATSTGVPGGLSPDGRWLVVQGHDAGTTRMLVISTGSLNVAHRVALAGDFTFDAINDAGTNLYLIQRLAGREYYVRLYDLPSGTLTDNIVVDKSDGNQAMTGTRLSGVASLGGDWLFSMYVREDQGPFIHALSLDGPFAFCLDLRGGGYASDRRQMQWALAMAPDGRTVFAVNLAAGTVAVASTGGDGAPAVQRTAQFEPAGGGAATGPAVALVSGGTLIAGGTSGLAWIDTTTLRVTGRSLPGWTIAGVGLSPDGKNLYAVNRDGMIAVVAVATRQVTGMFDPSAGAPLALMRVATA